jgi:hypothetical protein
MTFNIWRGVALTLPQDHLLRWKEMVAGVRMYPATHPLSLCGFGCRGLSNLCECTTICVGWESPVNHILRCGVGLSRTLPPVTNVFLSPTTPFIFLFLIFFFLILYFIFLFLSDMLMWRTFNGHMWQPEHVAWNPLTFLTKHIDYKGN